MTPCAITLENVRRRHDRTETLRGVSLHAPEGQVLALLGASGSGKSTILRLAAGLEPVDAGRILLGDEVVSEPGRTLPAEARKIGMVFQDYALFPHLTLGANVGFGLSGASRSAREDAAKAWLDRVGLRHRAQAYPHELSGGEQQRVALARALAPSPRAVLLDEPFSGLDPMLRSELRDNMLGALREAGVTVIFVTHDSDEAFLVADRLAILKQGLVLQEGLPRELYRHPASLEVAAALGPVNVFDGAAHKGAVATPFGAVATHLPDGAPARVAVRAEAVRVAPGVGARVRDRRPLGAVDSIHVEASGLAWRALVAPQTPRSETVSVTLDPDGSFAFARTP